MKNEIKTPVMIAVVVALVAVVGLLIFKFAGAGGDLDQGQVKYTPGTPPWMEKGGNTKYQPVPDSAPAQNQAGAQGGANLPPGMTAPQVGGNK